MRILHVEDNSLDAGLLRDELRRRMPEASLDWVRTLAEARAALTRSEAYDAVLTDMHLPDGDGIELVMEIRERGLPVAIVVLTGSGDETTAVASLRAGADDYVPKGASSFERLPATLNAAVARVTHPTRPLRLLYAEDDAADIEMTRRHLMRYAPQWRLEVVGSAEALLERVRSVHLQGPVCDVMLIDFRLGGENALEVLKELREGRTLLDIPVVLITGQGDADIAARALALGASDYLVKEGGYLQKLPSVLDSAYHRHRLEQDRDALWKSEARLSGIINTAMDAIILIDQHGTIVDFNPAAERLFGYSKTELMGERFAEKLLPPDERSPLGVGLDWLRVSGSSQLLGQRVEVTAMRSNETTFPAELAVSRVAGIEPPFFTAHLRDITARREAETALLHHGEYLRGLHQITLDLLDRQELDDVLRAIVHHAAAMLDATYSAVLLAEGDRLVTRGATRNVSSLMGQGIDRAEAPVLWKALESREPLAVDDYAMWPNQLTRLGGMQLRALVCFPIVIGGVSLGVLALARTEPDQPFSRDEIEEGLQFARLSALVVDNASTHAAARREIEERKRAEDRLLRQNAALERLNEVALMPDVALRDALARVVEVGRDHLNVEVGAISRVVAGASVLEVLESAGGGLTRGRTYSSKGTVSELLLNATDVVAMDHVAQSTVAGRKVAGEYTPGSFIGAPVRIGGRVLVVLIFASADSRDGGFDATDFGFVRLLARWVEATLERDESIARLRESEARLAGIIDSASDAIITIDGEGRIVVFNAAAEQVFRLPAADAVGQPIDTFLPARFDDSGPEPLLRFGDAIDDARAPEHLSRISARRANGDAFPAEVHVSRPKVAGLDMFSIVLRDLTEPIRAEAERRSLESQLRIVQKMDALGTLAGGIAHDFNNILGAIIGAADHARTALAPGHPARGSIEDIETASSRAAELVRQILTFSRQQQVARTVMPLRPIVEEVVRLLRATIPAGIELSARFVGDAPQVLAESTQVHQLLMNLATNARQAIRGDTGRIEITVVDVTIDDEPVFAPRELSPGHYVRVAMTDTGVGMDEETLSRIFDPFFTTKAVGEGTGLGLSMAHGIMKEHGGAIAVESTRGAGSTFHLYFPAAAPAVADESKPRPATPTSSGLGRHVLYLDDEEVLVRLASGVLERADFAVSGFTSPSDAMEAVRANPAYFDLIITDVNMPRMSGLVVAGEIAKIRPELPVILVSGYVTDEFVSRAVANGVSLVLRKPVSPKDLVGAALHVITSAK